MNISLKIILLSVNEQINILTAHCRNRRIDQVEKDKIPNLMAYLFAIWTIKDFHTKFK